MNEGAQVNTAQNILEQSNYHKDISGCAVTVLFKPDSANTGGNMKTVMNLLVDSVSRSRKGATLQFAQLPLSSKQHRVKAAGNIPQAP